MLSVFCSPGRYTQGRGATTALGREMKALGLEGPALVIAGKTVISHLAAIWKSSLNEAGIHHEVHRFGGECSTGEIERVKAAARQHQARTIIGAGGGKVLDAAHAVQNGLTAVPDTQPYFHGEKVAFGLLVQLILEGAPGTTMKEVLTFSSDVELPITLADIGLANVARDRLTPIALRATAPGETIHNEPFEVTPDMVIDAILAADALGREWRKHHEPRVRRSST